MEGGCIEEVLFSGELSKMSHVCELDSILCSKKFQYSLIELNMADYMNK